MQAVIDIKFNELLKIIKNLPENKLSELKAEIEKETKANVDRDAFGDLLLNGPVFSKEQIDNIAGTRQAINQWRTK
jgi:hypothetical protein